MKLPASLLMTLAIGLLLAALSLVTWRQARALETLAELDRHRREISLMTAERTQLENRIQALESRGRVVPTAREMLDMRTPNASEIVLLPGALR